MSLLCGIEFARLLNLMLKFALGIHAEHLINTSGMYVYSHSIALHADFIVAGGCKFSVNLHKMRIESVKNKPLNLWVFKIE